MQLISNPTAQGRGKLLANWEAVPFIQMCSACGAWWKRVPSSQKNQEPATPPGGKFTQKIEAWDDICTTEHWMRSPLPAHLASQNMRHASCPPTPSLRTPWISFTVQTVSPGRKGRRIRGVWSFLGGWVGCGRWRPLGWGCTYVLSKVTSDISTLSYFFVCEGNSLGVWTTQEKNNTEDKERKKYIHR